MSKIVLASNNSHKIKEFEKILDGASVEIISQSSLNIPEAPETGLTFIENAILKARNACFVSGLPAIADDSGIEVDALSGRPGIYSARYAGEKCDDEENNSLLLKELKNIPFKNNGINEPSFLNYVAQSISECLNKDINYIRKITVNNTKRFFSI